MYAAFAALQLGPQAECAMLSRDIRPSCTSPMQTPASTNSALNSFRLVSCQMPFHRDGDQRRTRRPVGDRNRRHLETCNAEDQDFGTEGLRNCVVSNATAPLNQLAVNVLAVVAEWGKQQDDQTLLIVRSISNA